jgi:hypothetical protein
MIYKQLFKKPRQNAAFQKSRAKSSFSKKPRQNAAFRKAAPKCSFSKSRAKIQDLENPERKLREDVFPY